MNIIEFIEHNAIWRGKIPLLTPSDAIKLISLCEIENRKILGIDTFYVFEKAIQPLLEESIDYSIEESRLNVWQDAKEFIRAKNEKKYYYEIVYD